MLKVAVLMGSGSDADRMAPAAATLKSLGVPFEVRVISAHRTPDAAREYAATAHRRGIGVIIAGAGMAAHLAGALAAQTTIPVIGVPLSAGALNGVDALYSTLMMPSGFPVATVAIDGAANAALLAAQILALNCPELAAKIDEYRLSLSRKAETADIEVQKTYSDSNTQGGCER